MPCRDRSSRVPQRRCCVSWRAAAVHWARSVSSRPCTTRWCRSAREPPTRTRSRRRAAPASRRPAPLLPPLLAASRTAPVGRIQAAFYTILPGDVERCAAAAFGSRTVFSLAGPPAVGPAAASAASVVQECPLPVVCRYSARRTRRGDRAAPPTGTEAAEAANWPSFSGAGRGQPLLSAITAVSVV